MSGFRGSVTYRKTIDLVKLVYILTEALPSGEKYGLISQMRRASVSVSANMAEGYGRGSSKEFIQFTNIARGSLSELVTLADIAVELGYLQDTKTLFELTDECAKLIAATRKSLQARVTEASRT